MSIIDRKGEGFLSSPFEDPVFATIARMHGFEDDGRAWPATELGIISRNMPNIPKSMPEFLFTQGHAHYDGILTVEISKSPIFFSYVHSAILHPHLLTHRKIMPETLWTALPGRPVSALMDHPAFSEMTIVGEQMRSVSGNVHYSDIRIEHNEAVT